MPYSAAPYWSPEAILSNSRHILDIQYGYMEPWGNGEAEYFATGNLEPNVNVRTAMEPVGR